MILLQELKINNFLSHAETTILFKEVDKISIEGRSGSGKSSIAEAILWCFYGKGRSENRSLVRRGSKTAMVSLKLIEENQETIITRSVSNTGKNILTITQNTGPKAQFLPIGRVGLKDQQEWIEKEFLKASFELFTNSICYPQDNENSFVKASASRRKDLLLEIVRAGSFDDLYEKTRKILSVNELENAVSLTKIESLETSIIKLKEDSKKYEIFKKSFDDTVKSLEALVSTEKSLESQIIEISTTTTHLLDKKKTRQLFVNNFLSINESLSKDQKLIWEHNQINIESAKKDIIEIEKLNLEVERIEKELQENMLSQHIINNHLSNKPQIFDYTKDLEDINKRLIPLIKDSSICPAGDDCPFTKPIQGQIEFLTEQITEKTLKSEQEKRSLEKWDKINSQLTQSKDTTELYAQLNSKRNQVKTLEKSKEIITKYELFGTTLKEIKEREISFNEQTKTINQQIGELDVQIKELEKTLDSFDINKINIDLANIRISISNLRKVQQEAATSMTLATNAQEALKIAVVELLTLNKSLLKTKGDSECLELLKEALGPKGIKAVVVDYIIPQLETRINDILSQMSDFRIRLDTQQSKADPEDGNKEGLFIIIKNPEGEELPLNNLSGGETVKVSMAISEGLASLMSSVGFRLLDECVTALDQDSLQSFSEIVLKLQEKFPQLLMISHLQDIKDLFENRVMVVKINGISTINGNA